MAAILRAVLGYYFLVFMMRIAGRRPGKQLTPMEFVLVFFSGGLALTAIVADDQSFTNALSQITAVAAAHYLLVMLRGRFPGFSRAIDGTPVVLLEKGKWHQETLISESITDDDVMAMARDQGLKTLEDVEYAVLERNGEISIIPVESSK